MSAGEVRVKRVFAATPERVFAALTDPDELVQWWGPRGISTSHAEIDLRPGGSCLWVMHPEGETAVLRSEIVDVDPPRLVSMTNQWTTRQGPDALRPLMAEDFTFSAGEMVVSGREAFLASGAWPDDAVTTMVAEAYGDATAIQIYDATNHGVTVRIADHLTVTDGHIASADVLCDGTAFEAFMGAG